MRYFTCEIYIMTVPNQVRNRPCSNNSQVQTAQYIAVNPAPQYLSKIERSSQLVTAKVS